MKDKYKWKCSDGHVWNAIASSVAQGVWCPICGRAQAGMNRRLGIEKMKNIAISRGGICLSNEYIGSDKKLRWQCKEEHQWEAVPDSIIAGRWCPICSGKKSYDLEKMKNIATKKGGKCLSKKYLGIKTKLKWICGSGHAWKATPDGIINGNTWCPTCAKIRVPQLQRDTIENMNKIAEEKGGRCISRLYVNNGTKLEWECAKGHRWFARPVHVKRGSWCWKCHLEKRKSQKLKI